MRRGGVGKGGRRAISRARLASSAREETTISSPLARQNPAEVLRGEDILDVVRDDQIRTCTDELNAGDLSNISGVFAGEEPKGAQRYVVASEGLYLIDDLRVPAERDGQFLLVGGDLAVRPNGRVVSDGCGVEDDDAGSVRERLDAR